MNKNRLEAFSDGVIAIIITIMVLELKSPHGSEFQHLASLGPTFLFYALSFVFIGIYWNNHHHLLQASKQISGRVLWANLHLLFWLSLVPLATIWMGEFWSSALPVATYGFVLFGAGFAYHLLTKALLAVQANDETLKKVIGADLKGKFSVAAYAVAVPGAFLCVELALCIYILVALFWLAPDRRIEAHLRI